MGFNESTAQLEDNTLVPAPRIRTNRTTMLTLSTTYQRIDFNGTSSFNTNTFPLGADGTNKKVYWDSTNKLFKFQASSDRNYDISLYMNVSASTLISGVNLTMASLKLRFVVPSPTPIYFPFPEDTDPHADLNTVNAVTPRYIEYDTTFYANSSIRQYGLGLELALSNTVVGTVTLNSSNLVLYGR